MPGHLLRQPPVNHPAPCRAQGQRNTAAAPGLPRLPGGNLLLAGLVPALRGQHSCSLTRTHWRTRCRPPQRTLDQRPPLAVACRDSVVHYDCVRGSSRFPGSVFRRDDVHRARRTTTAIMAHLRIVGVRSDRWIDHRIAAYDCAGALLLRYAHPQRGLRSAIHDGRARSTGARA